MAVAIQSSRTTERPSRDLFSGTKTGLNFVDDLINPLMYRHHLSSIARWAKEVEKCLTIDDLRKVMVRRVPPVTADYFLGAASDEITMGENELAFQRVRFNPSYALRFPTIDMTTTVLGHELSLPVIAGPIGSLRSLWPRGEAAAAAAIGKAGTICTLSTLTGTRMEEVISASGGPCWFQLYLVGGKEAALKGIARAKAAGYSALMLTIDTPVAGRRLRDERNGSKGLINGSLLQKAKFTPQMMKHLSWVTSFFADGGLMKFPNIDLGDGKPMPYAEIGKQLQASAVTWKDLDWIRSAWGGKIVIKGVHNLADAKLAEEHGADAVVISNHGGRQLDRVLPTLEILRRVAPDFKSSRCELLMDGGVRSGADVVAALALGARAVLVGRAYAFGLGAGGEAGVARTFTILREQIEHQMRQLGCGKIGDIKSSHLVANPF